MNPMKSISTSGVCEAIFLYQFDMAYTWSCHNGGEVYNIDNIDEELQTHFNLSGMAEIY